MDKMAELQERKKELFLTMLGEECAEVVQALSKIRRFGINSVSPYDGRTNREILVQELGDVEGMIELIKSLDYLKITDEELEEAKQKKIQKALYWLNNPVEKAD